MNTSRAPSCPSPGTLSNWLDDELGDAEAAFIRAHLESCTSCRDQVLGWAEAWSPFTHRLRASSSRTRPIGLREEHAEIETRASGCPDDETLVAYSEGELTADIAALAESHVRDCVRCTKELDRILRLSIAVGRTAVIESARQSRGPNVVPSALRLRVSKPWRRFHREPLPAAAALAAAAALIIVVAQNLSLTLNRPVLYRGTAESVHVEVIADQVSARARPGDGQALVGTLPKGTTGVRLEEQNGWTRIELPDGRRVWVASRSVVVHARSGE